jgi:predicted phage terminase large subunit-like protein
MTSRIQRTVERRHLNEAIRDNFPLCLRFAFKELNPGEELKWNWHLDAMCWLLSRTTNGDVLRALSTIPPRHLKSITVSVAYVAWMMGRNPALKFLVASYGAELANDLAGQFRRVVRSKWYRSAFPEFKIQRNVDNEIRTTLGGCRKAVSVGGATTGFGADYIIVDDLMKAADAAHPLLRDNVIEYFRGSLMSRLNQPETGRIIVVAQRLHEDDVPGFCLSLGLYEHLNLPAVAPTDTIVPLGDGARRKVWKAGEPLFLSHATLERLRKELGKAYSAQYLQDPSAALDQYLKFHAIPRYKEAPPRDWFEKIVQSWDTAISNHERACYSVCTTWGFYEGKWYLLDLLRDRLEYVELRDRLRAHRDRWRPDIILIEKKASGAQLISDLNFERNTQVGRHDGAYWRIHADVPTDDKETRWAGHAAQLMDGTVVFPEEAPWLEELRRELVCFPNSRHDDQVDSVSQFLGFTRLRTGRNLMGEYNDRISGYDRPRFTQRPNPGPRPR